MGVGVVVLNMQGRVVFANKRVSRVSGFMLPQIIDRKPSELWGGHMRREVYEKVWDSFINEKPHFAKMENRMRSGRPYTSNFHIGHFFGESGEKYALGLDVEDVQDSFVCAFSHAWKSGPEAQRRFLSSVLHTSIDGKIGAFFELEWINPLKERFKERYIDHQLVENAVQNKAAFSVLYEKYYTSVFLYLLSKTGKNDSTAEELTQETFLRAFMYLDSFTNNFASYKTYLYRVAHSRFVSYLRKQKEIEPLESVQRSCPDSNKRIDDMHLHFRLQEIKQMISPAEYRALVAFYIEREKISEIAIAMGRSSNAVKLLLSRARKKIRKKM